MRARGRAKQKLYYALFNLRIPVLDENGDETGDYASGYETPVEFRANISANKGEAYAQPFGNDLDYSKTIYTTDTLPIMEGTLIWQGTVPPTGRNDGATADYRVVKVGKSLNNTTYAVKTVTRNGASTV